MDYEFEAEGFTEEEFKDIKQCLETLLSIRSGSQPLDRNLGIDYDSIAGYPMDVARNMLALEIIEKVNTYEPRVTVESVDFETNIDGQIKTHIHFIRNDNYEVQEAEDE